MLGGINWMDNDHSFHLAWHGTIVKVRHMMLTLTFKTAWYSHSRHNKYLQYNTATCMLYIVVFVECLVWYIFILCITKRGSMGIILPSMNKLLLVKRCCHFATNGITPQSTSKNTHRMIIKWNKFQGNSFHTYVWCIIYSHGACTQ